jgi:hypothetical protein
MPNDLAVKNANVTISIKGLALSYYQEEKEFWETRFLRHVAGHNLTLTIKKNGAVTFSEKIDILERISIVSGHAEKLPPRHAAGDDKDLSHLVNFNSSEMVGENFKFNDKEMTILKTFNSCFYSKTLSAKEYTVQKNGQKVFSRQIGVITGGDIVAADQTEIKFANSPRKNQTLTAEPGVVYEVIFDNDCPNPPEDGSSDFDRYHEVIQTTHKFKLVGPDVIGFQGGDLPPQKDPPCGTAEGGEKGGGG